MAIGSGSPRFQKQAHPRQQDESVGDYEFGKSPSQRGAGQIGGRGMGGAMKFKGGASQGRPAKTTSMGSDEKGDED